MLRREAEETLAPKMSLAERVADSGDSADSLGFSPGERVIPEQRHHGSHIILPQGKGTDIGV